MEVIGYIERVDLPGLELFALDAKIDTGADSCSMHCDDIEVEGGNVVFTLHDEVHPAYHGKRLTLPIFKTKNVKSNMYEAEISLTNRENMKYPMLIGRRFLSHHYLIDVSHKYITKES